jgi:hypothetical protein
VIFCIECSVCFIDASLLIDLAFEEAVNQFKSSAFKQFNLKKQIISIDVQLELLLVVYFEDSSAKVY